MTTKLTFLDNDTFFMHRDELETVLSQAVDGNVINIRLKPSIINPLMKMLTSLDVIFEIERIKLGKPNKAMHRLVVADINNTMEHNVDIVINIGNDPNMRNWNMTVISDTHIMKLPRNILPKLFDHFYNHGCEVDPSYKMYSNYLFTDTIPDEDQMEHGYLYWLTNDINKIKSGTLFTLKEDGLVIIDKRTGVQMSENKDPEESLLETETSIPSIQDEDIEEESENTEVEEVTEETSEDVKSEETEISDESNIEEDSEITGVAVPDYSDDAEPLKVFMLSKEHGNKFYMLEEDQYVPIAIYDIDTILNVDLSKLGDMTFFERPTNLLLTHYSGDKYVDRYSYATEVSNLLDIEQPDPDWIYLVNNDGIMELYQYKDDNFELVSESFPGMGIDFEIVDSHMIIPDRWFYVKDKDAIYVFDREQGWYVDVSMTLVKVDELE